MKSSLRVIIVEVRSPSIVDVTKGIPIRLVRSIEQVFKIQRQPEIFQTKHGLIKCHPEIIEKVWIDTSFDIGRIVHILTTDVF